MEGQEDWLQSHTACSRSRRAYRAAQGAENETRFRWLTACPCDGSCTALKGWCLRAKAIDHPRLLVSTSRITTACGTTRPCRGGKRTYGHAHSPIYEYTP